MLSYINIYWSINDLEAIVFNIYKISIWVKQIGYGNITTKSVSDFEYMKNDKEYYWSSMENTFSSTSSLDVNSRVLGFGLDFSSFLNIFSQTIYIMKRKSSIFGQKTSTSSLLVFIHHNFPLFWNIRSELSCNRFLFILKYLFFTPRVSKCWSNSSSSPFQVWLCFSWWYCLTLSD